jgi:hypothetical protein
MASKAPNPTPSSPAPALAHPPVPVHDLTPERVREELWPRPSPAFAPMAVDERAELGAIVAALARAAMTSGDLRALAARARGIGFCLEIWRVRGRVFWVLREQPEQRRGAGAYVLRPGPPLEGAPEIVLQAPHAYFDRGTGNLAAALFLGEAGRGRARALFTNTAHRYKGRARPEPASVRPAPDGAAVPVPAPERPVAPVSAPVAPATPVPATSAPAARDRDEGAPAEPAAPAASDHGDTEASAPSDVAHSVEHAFHAATERIVRVFDRVVVIQLHGFSDRPGEPEIILSDGSDHAPARITALAAALGESFERVLRYPDDIDELGGLTNVQGRMLAGYSHAYFVHVELSGTTRRRLGRTPALLARFAHALLSAAY